MRFSLKAINAFVRLCSTVMKLQGEPGLTPGQAVILRAIVVAMAIGDLDGYIARVNQRQPAGAQREKSGRAIVQ